MKRAMQCTPLLLLAILTASQNVAADTKPVRGSIRCLSSFAVKLFDSE